MGQFVCLNGDIIERDAAMVGAFDRSFLYGDGLFETVRACGGSPFMLSEQGLLFHAGPFVGSLPVKRRVMSEGGDPGLPFIQEPQMVGHLLILEEDLHPFPELVDLHILTNQSFRNRVAVGIDLHVARHVHGSIQGLIDGRNIGRQGREVRFFHHIGRLGGLLPRERFTFWFATSRHHLAACSLRSCQSEKARPAR